MVGVVDILVKPVGWYLGTQQEWPVSGPSGDGLICLASCGPGCASALSQTFPVQDSGHGHTFSFLLAGTQEWVCWSYGNFLRNCQAVF